MTIHRAYGYVDRAAQREGEPLRVVMATEGRKADGIDLRMSGARLERFRGNPVLGYGHSYWGRTNLPIGRVDPQSIEVDGTKLSGDLDFDQEDEFARTVERKMRDRYINAVSIGFDVVEWESENDNYWRGGVATLWDLTELSVVPVGMDEKALVTAGRGVWDDTDRAWLRQIVDEFGYDRVAAVVLGPKTPAGLAEPPKNDPAPSAPGVDQDAARDLLAAFAPKENR
jgi:HK97 family phage prohead protease